MSEYSTTEDYITCLPMYELQNPAEDTVVFLGTATLGRFGTKHFILTAAHVIDERRVLLLRGPDDVIYINRPRIVSRLRPKLTRFTDPIDLGVVHLQPDEIKKLSASCRFVDFETEAVCDIPAEPCSHRIEGYSESNNIPDVHSRSLPAFRQRVDMKEDPNILIHAHEQDYKDHPHFFLGLRYDPRDLEGSSSQPKVDTFHGFSGGAIWRTEGKVVIGFAGMVTEGAPPRRTGECLLFGIRAGFIRERLAILN